MTTTPTDPRAVLEGYAQGETTIQVVVTEHLAPKAFAALRAVLDYADDLDKIDLYAAPAHCLRTLISQALEAK